MSKKIDGNTSVSGVPFVDFYAQYGISPVSQDLSDLAKHFSRRASLYRHLGLVPGFLRGRSILEFGPGGPWNPLFTASLDPSRYLLVDGNQKVMELLKTLVATSREKGIDIEVQKSLIQQFDTNERFDLVLCEGLLPGQKKPGDLFRHVSRFAIDGGVVVVTCMDSVSYLPEILRRFLGWALVERGGVVDFEGKTEMLCGVFESHLNTLKDCSRPIRDWVHDGIINPIVGSLFSIPEALEAADGKMVVLGASPKILSDWRWYKSITGAEVVRSNELACEQYMMNAHNFLDHRYTHAPRGVEENGELIRLCECILAEFLQYQGDLKSQRIFLVCDLVSQLVEHVSSFSRESAVALDDWSKGMRQWLSGDEKLDLGRFPPLFGRGQQYISFINAGA